MLFVYIHVNNFVAEVGSTSVIVVV